MQAANNIQPQQPPQLLLLPRKRGGLLAATAVVMLFSLVILPMLQTNVKNTLPTAVHRRMRSQLDVMALLNHKYETAMGGDEGTLGGWLSNNNNTNNVTHHENAQIYAAEMELLESQQQDMDKHTDNTTLVIMNDRDDAANESSVAAVAAVNSWERQVAAAFNNASTTKTVYYSGMKNVTQLAMEFFGGRVCQHILDGSTAEDHPHILVNVSFDCQELFKKSELGTGNFISAFFGLRMKAQTLGNMTVVISCSDAMEQRSDLILPWMTGFFPPSQPTVPVELRKNPSVAEACSGYKSIPVAFKAQEMRFEMRRMAIAMVGIPYPEHPAAAFAEKYLYSSSNNDNNDYVGRHNMMQLPHPQRDDPPLFPNVDLDEAVLHFRCGDLIMSNHPSFGFMKFDSFARHIDPDIRSIGIATQPFAADAQQRNAEGGGEHRRRCRTVVYSLVDHLQERFPNATVTLRNDVNETIALTFARMIMAKQVIIAISSFGVFPGISTFGRGYIRNPDFPKAPNRWLLKPHIEEIFDNVKLVNEPRLMAQKCKNMWGTNGTEVLKWFKEYDMPPFT